MEEEGSQLTLPGSAGGWAQPTAGAGNLVPASAVLPTVSFVLWRLSLQGNLASAGGQFQCGSLMANSLCYDVSCPFLWFIPCLWSSALGWIRYNLLPNNAFLGRKHQSCDVYELWYPYILCVYSLDSAGNLLIYLKSYSSSLRFSCWEGKDGFDWHVHWNLSNSHSLCWPGTFLQ